jgi:hypothetical protein
VHLLLKFVHLKLPLHSEQVGYHGFCALAINLLCRLDFGNVCNHVLEVVDEVESEELLKEVVLELGKEVDIALLAVPGF